MKQFIYIPIVLILSLFGLVPVLALPDVDHPLIVELQTGTKASASEEFIKLFNNTNQIIDASAIRLEYRSATGTTWSIKATLHGSWYPHKYYLLASKEYLITKANDSFIAGFAKTGGHIRLSMINALRQVVVYDQLGWGSAIDAEGNKAAPVANEDNSVARAMNPNKEYLDTNNNLADFSINILSKPESNNLPEPVVFEPEPPLPITPTPTPIPPTVVVVIAPVPVITLTPVTPPIVTSSLIVIPSTIPSITIPSSSVVAPVVLPAAIPVVSVIPSLHESVTVPEQVVIPVPIMTPTPPPPAPTSLPVIEQPTEKTPTTPQTVIITELFPDPKSPQTDAVDEYIELYNSGDKIFDLSGYKLQSGNTYGYSYTLNLVIAPNSYIALKAAQTKVPLSNAGSRVRLVAPNGSVVSETSPYVAAKTGETWALINGLWQWTDQVTEAAPNVAASPTQVLGQVTAGSETTKIKAALRSAVAKLKTTPKSTATSASPKTVSAAKAEKITKPVTKSGSTVPKSPAASQSVLPLHPFVLVGVGILAVGYGLYEYRHDIKSKFRQLRRNNSAGPKTRSIFEG